MIYPAAVFLTTSVEPPVEGVAKSIISLGIGMVLLSKLNAAGIFWVRTFCVVNSLLPYFECKTGSMFPLLSVLSLSFRFILLPFLLDLEGTSSIAAVLRLID